jgi:hypothetical protein
VAYLLLVKKRLAKERLATREREEQGVPWIVKSADSRTFPVEQVQQNHRLGQTLSRVFYSSVKRSEAEFRELQRPIPTLSLEQPTRLNLRRKQ